uniref:CW-type domain-containing protein n=1 Tax=Chenopodium quinoa TaxID=63459 RepID=A0A803NCP2_CHEQI
MPSPEKNESDQKSEWNKFFNFLHGYNKVATVKLANMKIHVIPSQREPNVTDDGLYFSHATVAYDLQELCDTSVDQRHATIVMHKAAVKAMSPLPGTPLPSTRLMLEDEVKNPLLLSNSPRHFMKNVAFESDAYLKGSSSAEKATCSSISKCHEHNSLQLCSTKEDVAAERNFVTDPSYLKTLGHAHSGWIFGAIAELVDNSRDARASRLEIAVETIFDKTVGSEIPMLSVIDDGVGMNHQEILRMISFGHKVPDEDNQDCIGRFGVGFKNVEIPVVSYCRQAQCMDIDTSVQSEALAKYNLNAMKQFSPFNEYLIGEKAGLFRGNTGTQIYIWNLDKWGAEYTLEWQAGLRGGSTFHQGDIYIRSRRVRKRPGQTSRKVSLDYSLRSYLEVIFLEPRMKIYVQGSLVRSRPLAKSLNNTAHHNGEIMGKQVRLTLGRCQIEWDEANCGIFLYWHGRLIEAYKRVGGMVHSADMGRGVIGVVEVTELMDDGNGGVWVHNNKQGFQDCEPYALLEEWLGKQADEYWDKFFDPVQLKKGHARYKPDNEWVQCDKCRKWRLLNADFDSMNLPKDWFCYMDPFNGRCEMPEQKPGHGVITVELKRSSGHDPSKIADSEGLQIGRASPIAEAKGEDKSTQPAEGDEKTPTVKKARRGKGQDKSTPPAEDDEEIPVIKRRKRGVQNARKYIQD